MTTMLRRISDRISDQTPKLRRISDRITDQAAAGFSAISHTAREYPKASAAIVVGAALTATAVWLLVRFPVRFLMRRKATERSRTASHTVRRGRRVRAGRVAAA